MSRIQVFDDRPDGLGSGGGHTLNLELREDRRRSTFGRVEGGGGADVADRASVRYTGRASANRFGPSLRVSAVGSVNNVNEPGLTGREYLGLVGTGDARTGRTRGRATSYGSTAPSWPTRTPYRGGPRLGREGRT